MDYRNNILETIGNTPMVKLNKVVEGLPCLVLGKIETFNPGHSTKDRMALKMVEDAEKEGRIGLFILIIGIPFLVLFLTTVRVLSLVEGRIVETMLGERMPRRPLYTERGLGWMERVKRLFTDPRTWSTMLYFALMLPLGIVYFTIAVTGLSVTLSFIAAPIAYAFGAHSGLYLDGVRVEPEFLNVPPVLSLPLLFVLGVLGFFAMLHLARGIGRLHGGIAKHLLVKLAAY